MCDVEQVLNEYIERYDNLVTLAYEREWFKEQEQYLIVVGVLVELKEVSICSVRLRIFRQYQWAAIIGFTH